MLLSTSALNGASLTFVYNLKIAETTKRQTDKFSGYHFIGASTPIFHERTRKNEVKQSALGSLESLIYYKKPFYARIDFAFAHVWEKLENSRFSRTLSDDILFTGGYRRSFSKKFCATLSGLIGIPTHRNMFLEGVQFGTGHYGIGIQLDSAINYAESVAHSFRTAYRCIHFLERDLDGKAVGLNEKFKFSYGNLMDFYIAHHFDFQKTKFELGYDFILLTGARIFPVPPIFALLPDRTNFKRSTFFAASQRIFFIGKHPSAVTLGLAYGFDHTPRLVGIKRLITSWIAWGINF